ncbi:hypothetical protein [Aeoliella mucimassa]|uniref:Uncharacterized protein n=1 Tax=Aeoliella mucimassa TaxID=2527972 RepID=A0A518ALZ1_9BACT|nr:hypothetical protein [Aeoliella mucimassa]QDU55726.1 hypothetical protein Pan181_19200 [Aeoliella mucimassa]
MKHFLLLAVIFSTCMGVLEGQPPQTPDEDALRKEEIRSVLELVKLTATPEWSYARLEAAADLIVIASVDSSTAMAPHLEIEHALGAATSTQYDHRLQVHSVLKGACGQILHVATSEWKDDVIVMTNSDIARLRPTLRLPLLVGTEIDGVITSYGSSTPIETYDIHPEYLLYLKKYKDDLYVPVSGQRFSGLSVRLLNN